VAQRLILQFCFKRIRVFADIRNLVANSDLILAKFSVFFDRGTSTVASAVVLV